MHSRSQRERGLVNVPGRLTTPAPDLPTGEAEPNSPDEGENPPRRTPRPTTQRTMNQWSHSKKPTEPPLLKHRQLLSLTLAHTRTAQISRIPPRSLPRILGRCGRLATTSLRTPADTGTPWVAPLALSRRANLHRSSPPPFHHPADHSPHGQNPNDDVNRSTNLKDVHDNPRHFPCLR